MNEETVAIKPKRYHVTCAEKFARFDQEMTDLRTPVSPHEIKILRKQMGITAKRLAEMLGCSKVMIDHIEQGRKNLVGFKRRDFHRIRRYVEMALNDMRDRFEMPNFKL